jgi:hypothetical protein
MEIYPIRTWFDSHHGVVAIDDDVLGVVKQVKAVSDGRLHIYYNPQKGHYDIVERCLDGTERFVFSVDKLDARVIDRLHLADQWGAETPDRGMKKPEGEDFLDELDKLNDEADEAKTQAARDKLGDVGERLAWSLDIVRDRPSVGGSISVPKEVK